MRTEGDLRQALTQLADTAPDPAQATSRFQLAIGRPSSGRGSGRSATPILAAAAAAVLVVLAVLVIPTLTARNGPAVPPPSSGPLLVGSGLVIDNGAGPRFCLGGVMESLPPQCKGPELLGWRWPKTGVERVGQTTWMDVTVVGTFDGERFTVVKTVDPSEVVRPASPDRDFRSPCQPPTGGWQAPDPDRATAATRNQVFAVAERLPDYTEAWIDENGDRHQDPKNIVVNVRVAGSVTAAERTLRRVWGGSLCVSKAEHSRVELRQILEQVQKTKGVQTVGTTDRVELVVLYDDGTLQRQLDQRYGAGTVLVGSTLKPYRG